MRIFGAACLLLTATAAYAGRPLNTEDAGVIDKGGFELENYYHRQSARGVESLSGLHVQPSVGIGFNTQIGIGVDFLRQYNADYEGRKSSGEYAIVGKTGLKALTDDEYGVAVAWSVDRTRAPGERFRYDNAALNSALTVPLEQWLLHANLGWARTRLGKQNSTTWALAAERIGAIGPLDLAAESYGNDHNAGWLGVAARWVVKEDKLFIDSSWAKQLGGERSRAFTLGLKLAY